MYIIYCDNEILYNPAISNDDYLVINPKLTLELGKSGNLKFTVPPTNQTYNSIQKLKSIIRVFDDDLEIFRGRVIEDDIDFYNCKSVYCEGILSYFIDSIVRPYSYTGTITNYIKKLILSHNNQVEDSKKFSVGNITVSDDNDYIIRANSEYTSTSDELFNKLVDIYGGYFIARVYNGMQYLDYLEDSGTKGTKGTQLIQFSENILDLTKNISTDGLFTVLIPLGAEKYDEDGNANGRVNIKSVNNNLDYIENQTGISLYGKIVGVYTWDDVTIPSNLLSKGIKYLNDAINMSLTLEIKAVDLHLIDIEEESICIGKSYRIISIPHNIDEYFICSKCEIDMIEPMNTVYTFGDTRKTLTEQQSSTSSNIKKVSSNANTAIAISSSSEQKVNTILSGLSSDYVETTVFNEYKQNVDSAINEVFQSVSSGKQLVASAITDKGVPTEEDATFQVMANNIKDISTGNTSNIATNNFKSSISYFISKIATNNFKSSISYFTTSYSQEKISP